ncbi:MAG TPA: DUF4080 domain-containing protein [Spirochaetota bacterium]|nr:DUF4080 domain-containing protein [Spirochaetota bacterium]
MTTRIEKYPDIILLGINARYSHSNPALYSLRAYCRGLDRRIEILETSINAASNRILADVIASRPGLVGISVYIWNARVVRGLLPGIKTALPDCRVVLGGPEVTHAPAEWLSMSGVDCVVAGPGEAAFRKIASGDFNIRERLIRGANPPFTELPFLYDDTDFARFANRYVYYESGRGCPYRCAYCLSSRGDARLEFRELSMVLRELDVLIAKAPGTVKFVDRTFNARPERARAIWRHLIDSGTEKRFHFEVHPALLADEDLALLETARPGLFQFEVGVQSTNEETLRAVHRAEDWPASRRAIARLIAPGNIRTHLDLIAGLPYDTLETIARSFDEAHSLRPDHLQLGFLKVLPGTEMRERAVDYELSFNPEPPYEVISNRWLFAGEIALLHRVEGLVDSLYNSGRFRDMLLNLAPRFAGPFAMFRALADHWVKCGLDPRKKDPGIAVRTLASFAAAV